MNVFKKRKKRSTWKPNEEEILLKLWEDNVFLLRSTRKNKTVLSDIAAQLKAVGFHYSSVEVKNKIHNLTTKYREEKKRIGFSGSPSGWDLYHKIDNILNEHYSPKLRASIEENTENPMSSSTDIDSQEDDSLIEPITRKNQLRIDEGEESIKLQAETIEIEKESSYSDSQDDDSFIEPIIKKKKVMDTFQEQCLTEFRATNSLIAKDMQELKNEGKEAIKLQTELVEIERERNSILTQFLKVYQGKNLK